MEKYRFVPDQSGQQQPPMMNPTSTTPTTTTVEGNDHDHSNASPNVVMPPVVSSSAGSTTTSSSSPLSSSGQPATTTSTVTSSIPINSNEVRITQQGKPRNYISYAMNLFSNGKQVVVLKAMGRAINKAVTIAEILKRKLPLHQINTLTSVEMIDVFEPLEEGLDLVKNKRYVSCMTITLATNATLIDTTDIGYQPPLAGGIMSSSTTIATPSSATTHTPADVKA